MQSLILRVNKDYYLLFHVYQRQETTPRDSLSPNAEHRLFKIKK